MLASWQWNSVFATLLLPRSTSKDTRIPRQMQFMSGILRQKNVRTNCCTQGTTNLLGHCGCRSLPSHAIIKSRYCSTRPCIQISSRKISKINEFRTRSSCHGWHIQSTEILTDKSRTMAPIQFETNGSFHRKAPDHNATHPTTPPASKPCRDFFWSRSAKLWKLQTLPKHQKMKPCNSFSTVTVTPLTLQLALL